MARVSDGTRAVPLSLDVPVRWFPTVTLRDAARQTRAWEHRVLWSQVDGRGDGVEQLPAVRDPLVPDEEREHVDATVQDDRGLDLAAAVPDASRSPVDGDRLLSLARRDAI